VTAERGRLFEQVAEEYDRARLGYSAEIVDAACAIAGLGPGSPVLEIGCGTGKLTELLAARSLSVEAVDPGAPMVEVARRRVGSDADVTFRIGRFEDVELPRGTFAAAFSATAFHWVDPEVGWAKVADVLRPGGIFALLTYTGFSPLDEQIHAVWTDVDAETGERWALRDRKTLFEGLEARLVNISEAWAWLNQRETLLRPEAEELFESARLTTAETHVSETAESLVGFMRTTSTYLALEPDQRRRLEEGLTAAVDEAGGSYPLTIVYVLVTARTTG
jgi:ubiquinone/menaquinone biosynthesis C-methylase UbiE